jgi:hypothetical protein
MALVGKNLGIDEAQQQNQPSIACVHRLLLAFNSATAASVASGSFIAFVLQPLQHKNTGRPLMSILIGVPIDPSKLSVITAQNF